MNADKRRIIIEQLLPHWEDTGTCTTQADYAGIVDVWGENGVLTIINDDRDEEIVTQEELGEAISFLTGNDEFEIGGSLYA
jgi:hypothetical protein